MSIEYQYVVLLRTEPIGRYTATCPGPPYAQPTLHTPTPPVPSLPERLANSRGPLGVHASTAPAAIAGMRHL